MERSDIQVLIDAIQDGVPNTALKVRTVLNAIADGSGVTGDIKEIDVPNAYLTANFDASGLGKNERLGWAICNGNNGTRDRSGRTSIQYSASYPTLGAIGGTTQETLTINQIPPHTHTVPANNGSGGIGGANYPAGGGTTVTTSSQGGGLPHNNMQPYIVTVMIQKL